MGCLSIAGLTSPFILLGGERHHDSVRVRCLAQEHNTMPLARARTQTAQSGDKRTNHEASRPLASSPIRPNLKYSQILWSIGGLINRGPLHCESAIKSTHFIPAIGLRGERGEAHLEMLLCHSQAHAFSMPTTYF